MIKTYSEFLNESQDQVYVKLIPEEDKTKASEMCHIVARGSDVGNWGTPHWGLYKGSKIIGVLCLEEDYLPDEYRFDIMILKHYRKKGYAKLLISEMFRDFIKNENADQISADIVNKKLSSYLESVWGFGVEYYDEAGCDRGYYPKSWGFDKIKHLI